MEEELRKVAFLSKKGEEETQDLKLCFEEIYNQCREESIKELYKVIMNASLVISKVTMTLSDISLAFDDYKEKENGREMDESR